MKGLNLSKDLKLPIEAATTANAIIAIRGAGKTYTAKVIAEEMIQAGVQTVIVDPTGVWWGLRAAADGKGAGLTVIVMGGNHGDVPLEETSGEVVAEFLVETGQSVVLDLSLLRKNAQKRFMADFAEHVYHLKAKTSNQTPLHVILDEADRFAPQKPQPEHARLLGAIEDIVRLGRSRGFGISMISQRAAVLNKDVLTQVETLIVLRTTSPQDRKAIGAWVEENASPEQFQEIAASLSSLPNGTAWVWSPSVLGILKKIQIRTAYTFNSSATPRIGEKRVEPKRMADVDLQALKGRIASTIEKAKANDPKELRRQIGELRAMIGKPPAIEFKDVVKEKRIEVPVLKEAQLKRVEAIVCKAEIMSNNVLAALAELSVAAASAAGPGLIQKILDAAPRETFPPLSRHQPRARPRTDDGIDLRRGERSILKVIAQDPAHGATREQITVMTGYKRSSRDTYIQRLSNSGYVENRGDAIVATQSGIEALGADYEPLPTGAALRKYWLNRLGGGERAILQVLLDSYPNHVEREKLSEMTPYQRSSRDTYLQRLSARRLVVQHGRGAIKASDILFSDR